MKDKVIKLLIKWGYNEESVKSMVEANLAVAIKSYPDAKPSFIANVVCTL